MCILRMTTPCINTGDGVFLPGEFLFSMADTGHRGWWLRQLGLGLGSRARAGLD